jgi:hypothetical protein
LADRQYRCPPVFLHEQQKMVRAVSLVFLLVLSLPLQARQGVYQSPESFLEETFSDQVPKPAMIWLTGPVGESATQLLQHKPDTRRLRYWRQDHRTAWVLNEIGKDKPITVGIVINEKRIETLKVLVFRESRGWEVKESAFTQQFIDASLNNTQQLSQHVDGITGATLSVRALKRLARLALYLHGQVVSHDTP